jgi:Flp pilus assembly pilin Flp
VPLDSTLCAIRPAALPPYYAVATASLLRLTRITQENYVIELLQRSWNDNAGQDVAEYAVMLAVILVIVVGTIRLIGSEANNTFSAVASNIGLV